jgi:Tol biopolymer transport system component
VALSADATTGSIGNVDLWILEFARGTAQRLTVDPALDRYPVWSSTGDRIVFGSTRDSSDVNLYARSSDGSGADRLLLKTDVGKLPTDLSRDGRYLLFTVNSPKTFNDVWLLPMDGPGTPTPLIQTPAGESEARFSPDMRWVSYTSNVSGHTEIYVRPFNPASAGTLTGAVTQISKDGGTMARWRKDSKELFYLSAAGAVTAVDIAGPGPIVGTPKVLFTLPSGAPWDVTPDGQRFLVGLPPVAAGLAPITVVTNWTAGLVK